MLTALAQCGGEYIANDRFFLSLADWRATSWPTVCRINPATLEIFAHLRPLAQAVQTARTASAVPPAYDKVLVLPWDIDDLLSTNAQRTAPLRSIVFLEQAPVLESCIVPQDEARAAAVLTRNLLTPADEDHPDWLGVRSMGKKDLMDFRRQATNRILSTLRTTLVKVGHPAHESLGAALKAAAGVVHAQRLGPLRQAHEAEAVSTPLGWFATPHTTRPAEDGVE